MADETERHIGHRIRAARDRLGWSKETLGSRSGVSWAAITQMESGRRTNTRSDTLLALSKALGVSIEYLLGDGAPLPRMFGHEAFLYSTNEELATTMAAFVSQGLDRGEGILLALPQEKVEAVRTSLGDRADGVEAVDSSEFYAAPQKALSTFHAFIQAQLGAGKPWVRIVAEPPWIGRSPAEDRVLASVESFIEASLAPLPGTMVCPYDKRIVSEGVLDKARRTHPHVRTVQGVEASSTYGDAAEVALNAPLEGV